MYTFLDKGEQFERKVRSLTLNGTKKSEDAVIRGSITANLKLSVSPRIHRFNR